MENLRCGEAKADYLIAYADGDEEKLYNEFLNQSVKDKTTPGVTEFEVD